MTAHALRGAAAIVGIGNTRRWNAPDRSPFDQLQEAAVLAIPHPRWQERPMLVVVRRAGATITADELRDHLAGLIPKWWLPDAIAFVPELPHGPTGKVQKDTLRQWLRDGKIAA